MIEDLSGKNLLEVPDKSRIISSPMDGFLLVGGFLLILVERALQPSSHSLTHQSFLSIVWIGGEVKDDWWDARAPGQELYVRRSINHPGRRK